MRGFKHFFGVPPIQTAELTIRGVGVQERMPPCLINRPRGTGDYLLMLFYDAMPIGNDDNPVDCPPGTLMIWTPGQRQYYGDRAQPFKHSWIHCNGKLINSLLRKNRLLEKVPLLRTDPSITERYLLDIHNEVVDQRPPDFILVRNLLENWLRLMARAAQSQETPASIPERLLAVRHYIEAEHAQPLALPEMAIRAGLSLSHFCALFKKHFGIAPIEYLIQHRMHRALYLLHDREITISEAGRRVGYDDLFHFSKLFKKHFGLSPRQWRAQDAPSPSSQTNYR